jgi:phosphatidylinositol kinase/protein kinase (PI-3  family)
MALWWTGEKAEALAMVERLASSIAPPEILERCRFLAADWLLELSPTVDGIKRAYGYLAPLIGLVHQPRGHDRRERKLFLKSQLSNASLSLSSRILLELTGDVPGGDICRRWCDVNTALVVIDPANTVRYVTNAIGALTRAIALAPSFPDVVWLLSLFFEHANHTDVFEATRSFSENVPPELLLQASPQLLVQVNHPTQSVAKFAQSVCAALLEEHYHEIVFPVIVMTKSKNLGRAKLASEILEKFRDRYPAIYDEVMLVRQCLLRGAITWSEKALQFLDYAMDALTRRSFDQLKECLRSIVKLIAKPPSNMCEMYVHFRTMHERSIATLEHLLSTFSPAKTVSLNQINAWCKQMQEIFGEEQKRIHIIQMSSISPALAQRRGFHLAVPGTYRPGEPLIRIEYFVGQFSVYMTKQQPKDVVLKGEDGCFYQYLLKGHEDLRLDERIMQFFRLINSLVDKEESFRGHVIGTVCVIPISPSHGLVQWIPGTDTLRHVVEQSRKLHGREPMEEYNLTEKLGTTSFDQMLPIQKMQIIETIFSRVPDSDIADLFWLKAETAEAWLKRTDTFAVSTGMTSIVGYVVGLGDRHPSNLLVDRFSGSVIHIDFGDCFERAAKRSYLPEVVPFRLTRMMVRAMGASGVDGRFWESFVNMSRLLRENQRVLVMVLAVFVQEPLIDPDEAERASTAASGLFTRAFPRGSEDESTIASSDEMTRRVKQKLTGTDFEEGVELGVEEQAVRLIEQATDTYMLSRMYSGWCPFW